MQSFADLRKYIAREQAELKPFSSLNQGPPGAIAFSQPNIPLPMSHQQAKRNQIIKTIES
jgi:hypothetical protein